MKPNKPNLKPVMKGVAASRSLGGQVVAVRLTFICYKTVARKVCTKSDPEYPVRYYLPVNIWQGIFW